MTGIIVLLAAVAVAVVLGAGLAVKNGRFSTRPSAEAAQHLTVADLGAPLGERATLVQFSSAFCAPCRATRVLLTDIAAKTDGVATVEIDAEDNLELVRELGIMRTPTVLLLDERGIVRTRASGLPRRDQVMAALAAAHAN